MTSFALIPSIVYPRVAHTKYKVFTVYSFKRTMSDAIYVDKSQPM